MVTGSSPVSATDYLLINYTIMKVLKLDIRQKPFDDILSGKKDFERREVKPSNDKD